MKKTTMLVLFLLMIFCFTACQSAETKIYNEASSALENDDYSKALELMKSIPEYDDKDGIKKMSEAAVAFLSAVDSANAFNSSIDEALNPAQVLMDSNEPVLEEAVKTNLQVAVSGLRERKKNIPEMPENADEIEAETAKLTAATDASEQLQTLATSQKAFEDSAKQMSQITNPTGDFIIERLNEIESVEGIQGVTEDNDPNGNLNKQGGYTSATYFSSTYLDQSTIYGDSIIDKGNNGGGCIEVYATAEEAESRNTYLSAFDGGGIISAGSHAVFGTIVIRTSDQLTATQQNETTDQIKAKLVELR